MGSMIRALAYRSRFRHSDGHSGTPSFHDERNMNLQWPRLVTGGLVIALVVLLAGRCLAVYHALGPAKDEWGLKYEVEISAADGDKLNVLFTLADQGKLKPIYSATVVAFSQPDREGFQSYLVNAPIVFKPTKDGKAAGQVQMRKEFIDRAMIRILTLTVNGRPQTAGAAYYDIPLKKFLNKTSVAASPPASVSTASQPESNVKK
jgi:hypothetical protein